MVKLIQRKRELLRIKKKLKKRKILQRKRRRMKMGTNKLKTWEQL
jgi:hypothetical protein